MLIMIDGPENSGKTLVANRIKEVVEEVTPHSAEIVKWTGRARPDEDVYLSSFEKALADDKKLYIWDRGWPSEFVYGRILNQDRPMALDHTIGWRKFDSKIKQNGLGVILSGSDLQKMDEMRDETDIQTNAALERALFEDYGETNGLLILRNNFNGQMEVEFLVYKILSTLMFGVERPMELELV
jgi:hypothetical protein